MHSPSLAAGRSSSGKKNNQQINQWKTVHVGKSAWKAIYIINKVTFSGEISSAKSVHDYSSINMLTCGVTKDLRLHSRITKPSILSKPKMIC